MASLPIVCVEKVSMTSQLLCELFGWKSTHGGEEFDELIDSSGTRMLWLHQLEAHEHPRFKDNHLGELGRGCAFYVFVSEVEDVHRQVQERSDLEIVEGLAKNPNAGFREFTFREHNGYHFTVAEDC